MSLRYNETALWNRTLGGRGNNAREESAIGILRSTFETAYERIKPIVRQAHLDCKGLTIHDETHLDALWQLADLIAGKNYPINPIEAFVFGCSVLFHDSALAVVAYEGGLARIKMTSNWQRAMVQMTGMAVSNEDRFSKEQLNRFESAALFTFLRSHHAKQASTMAEREWERSNGKGSIYIIEDTELR